LHHVFFISPSFHEQTKGRLSWVIDLLQPKIESTNQSNHAQNSQCYCRKEALRRSSQDFPNHKAPRMSDGDGGPGPAQRRPTTRTGNHGTRRCRVSTCHKHSNWACTLSLMNAHYYIQFLDPMCSCFTRRGPTTLAFAASCCILPGSRGIIVVVQFLTNLCKFCPVDWIP
jgi:hypothetical protein